MFQPQFDHLLRASFHLYLDHKLLQKARDFSNVSGELYFVQDFQNRNKDVWASNFRQWVSDSSISGATIASGVWYNGTFYNTGSGINIDYNNGRIIAPSGMFQVTGGSVTARFASKDINLYTSDESDEQILFSKKAFIISGIPIGLNYKTMQEEYRPIPGIYINYMPGLNDDWEFGGTACTKATMRAIVFADSQFMLDGCLGIFRDLSKKHFAIMDAYSLPYDSKGGLKSGVYHYDSMINNFSGLASDRLVFISQVSTSKLSNDSNVAVNKDVVIGIADFNIEIVRPPQN